MKILVALAGVALLAACHPAAPPPAAAPAVEAPSPVTDALKVLPGSPHVTGLPGASPCKVGKSATGKPLPDPVCTPGSISSAVTQANIKTTICVSGYATTIRPPVSETGPAKKASMRAYGEASASSGTTEYDHLVPLELSGSSDTSNLWAQPSDLPGQGFRNSKDTVENDLHAAVCSGKVTLSAAQIAIASNWTTAEHVLGIK